MKKFILSLTMIILTFVACAAFSACGDGDGEAGVAAESITFSETTIKFDSGATKELTYTVQPEDATVKIEISDSTVVKYENGTLTALTAGTATVKAYSSVDKSVYSECNVTVNMPSGYVLYTDANCKFAYPSSWTKNTVAGTTVAYASGAANVNLTTENKSNAYFSASASMFQSTIETTYKLLNYTVKFNSCTVDKNNYAGYTRVHVVYDYTLNGTRIYQEQMILNSGNKTCVLTVTGATATQTETIFSQFVGKN